MFSPGPAGKVVGTVARDPHMGGVARTSKCSCRRIQHERAVALAKGLKVVRKRFSVPRGELPDLQHHELDKFLLYQLRGAQRPSVHFPRVQRGFDQSGLPILSRLTKRDRWSLASTLASMKRGLSNEVCQRHRPQSGYQEWKANACRDDVPATDSEYLRFVRKACQKIFRLGWDSSYESFCFTFCPKDSGRYDPRTLSASQWWASNLDRKGFLRGTLKGKLDPIEGFKLRYKEIPAVGKVRPMGVPSLDYDFLGPLHKAMYQYIAGKEWCLRGAPTSKRVGKVCVNTYQTSIDLVSATDGLKIDVAETILGVALAKSVHVPGAIKVMACDSLRPLAYSKSQVEKGREGTAITHGQMMGTYLSFPLLCLQSYCAALWATRDCPEARFLVNGDDTLISAHRPILNSDYPVGFMINEKKTARGKTLAEINSTQFLKQGNRWSKVPLLRRGTMYDSARGHLHFVKVCIEAGPKWQEAYASTVQPRKGCFLPSSVGMDLRLRSVNQLERKLRASGYLTPPPRREREPRWEMCEDEPTWGDKVGFNQQLFEEGRDSEPAQDWGWSDCPFTRPSRIRCTTTVSQRVFEHALREKNGRVRKLWCYSSRYSRVEHPSPWKVEEEDGRLVLVPV